MPSTMPLLLFFLLSLSLAPLLHGQPSDPLLALVGDRTPEEIFMGNSSLFGAFVYPPATVISETPYVVRLVLLQTAAMYDAVAPCHPPARTFLGTQDHIHDSLCTPRNIGERTGLLVYFAMLPDHPQEAQYFLPLLQYLGFDTRPSTDATTTTGWAWLHAQRLLRFFQTDGWNSNGLEQPGVSPYVRRFADFTGYKPVNSASKSRFPLRWTPLTQQQDGRGRFVSQVHVTPHVGRTVTPLLLSSKSFRSRVAKPPYKKRNAFLHVRDKEDVRLVNKLIDDALNVSRALTYRQRALARWWDGKLFSLGLYSTYYHTITNMSLLESVSMYLGDMLAQHDAVLIAWRNKRIYDTARPESVIRHFRHGRMEDVYVNENKGVSSVNLSYYQSTQLAQPHSEYPSASAVQCTAGLESTAAHAISWLARSQGMREEDVSLPPFVVDIGRGQFNPRGLNPPVKISLKSPKQGAFQCGMSRLWAGVHFRPAVREGWRLGKGLGQIAHSHMQDLVAGRVPKDCARCGKF